MFKFLKRVRLYLASKLIGDTVYIKNCCFYQSLCLDINVTHDLCMINSEFKMNHNIKWVGPMDGFGIKFDRYEESISKFKKNHYETSTGKQAANKKTQ